jgi:3-oxoacyl-(acyl-carrier-protein) synthase/cyclopropane fatty-acyl-phospholipid synthase-like methyltransferase/acyl carrier protein
VSPVEQALKVVEDLERKLLESEERRFAPIAILGMACRAPGAKTPDQLWDLAVSGRRAFSDLGARWPIDEWYSKDSSVPGRAYIREAGLIEGIDEFDAPFFGISPREAERMDPQHRLLLELAWEALERAGIDPQSLAGSATGVFAGVYNTNYARFGMDSAGAERIDAHTLSGGAPCIATGRISYTLGLQGPSLTLDTACSSSLVAAQLAMESLRRGECSLALAGGIHLLLSPLPLIALSKSKMLSPSGMARAFDAAADGFMPGEGGGMVVLKRLADAERDGDPIVAVIRGGAVNQDGRSAGLTAPNGRAQEALLAASLRNAGVRAEEIAYFETHGTGTKLGDPIEVNAIEAALGRGRRGALPLGALKNSIGHLEAAAGVLGLIKTALVLERKMVPPVAGFDRLNPEIDAACVRIPRSPERLDGECAAVSSLGFGGTNANLVLGTAPQRQKRSAAAPVELVLSARSESALRALGASYAEYLERGNANWDDIRNAAMTRRAQLEYRAELRAASAAEAARMLRAWSADVVVTRRAAESDAPARTVTERGPMPAGLPVYPFERRRYWFDPSVEPVEESGASRSTGISHYFDAITIRDEGEANHHVTFGVFPKPVAGFSFVNAFFEPKEHPEQYQALVEGQQRLKSVLFSQVDLERVSRVMDYGCGLGADLIELAQRNPRLRLDGFTISAEQAAMGNRRAAALGLGDRLRIYHRDSAADAFPGEYDLILGFEVTGLIANKEALFDNVRRHLRPGGHLLIADCVAPFAIENDETSTYTLTADGWNALFAPRGLRLAELMDVSQEVANCIEDPLYQERLAEVGRKHGFDETTMRHLSSHGRIGPALRRGHLQYILLHAVAELAPSPRLREQNARWFAAPSRYSEPAPCAPVYEPEWAEIAAVDHDAMVEELARAERYSEYQAAEDALEQLASAYFAEAERRVGDRPVLPKFAKFYTRIRAHASAGDVDALRRRAGAAVPELRLLERCGAGLADAITGQADPLELIFAGGSVADAEALYRDSVPTRVLNAAAARLLRDELAGEQRPLRVLEVGAGTGGTTEAVLGVLPAASTYCFTDVSRHFLRTAEKKFGSGLEYRLFDLNDDAERQGLGGRQFDLIVAANSVHATRDLRASVRRLERMLAPGGRLLLVEAVGPLRWVDAVFGLTDGWWSFADDRDYALVPPERWRALLEEAGLAVEAITPSRQLAGKVVVLARKTAVWSVLADRGGVAESVVARLPGSRLLRAGEKATGSVLDFRALDLSAEDNPAATLAGIAKLAGECSELVLFTRGAQGAVSCPSRAAVWGLGRVLANEQKSLGVRLVDLDADAVGEAVASLRLRAAQVDWHEGRAREFRLRECAVDGAPEFRGDASYLVTGGSGGLAVAVAEWLKERGAGRVVLSSRSVGERADVTNADEVARLVARIDREGPPLRGVFHLAGVLEDAAVARLREDTLRRVRAPKVEGAWALHRATAGLPLDWFVLFSSAAAMVGMPGQCAHAAANAEMDAIAQWRRAAGLPAVTINWGAWRETGSAATRERLAALASKGVGGMSTAEALGALDGVLAGGRAQMAVLRIDWKAFRGAAPEAAAPASASQWKDAVTAAAPRERRDVLVSRLEALTKSVMGMSNGEVLHPRQPLRDAGLDSLLSLELRDKLGRELGKGLPATLLFEQPTLERLAEYVLAEMGFGAKADALADLETEELGRLLDEELSR